MSIFGERLRELRTFKRMSQDELAAIVGHDRTNIVHIEAGRKHPSDEMLVQLSQIFEIPYEQLHALRTISKAPPETQEWMQKELGKILNILPE